MTMNDPADPGLDPSGADPDDPGSEPDELGLVEWVEVIFAPMIQRRVDLGRGKTWCARWWAHPEVAVRLDALRMAWYEMTAADSSGRTGAGCSAWWVNHVDPTLATVLDGDTGPMSGCRPDQHAGKPVPPLLTVSPRDASGDHHA
jgi:hypothetical protein